MKLASSLVVAATLLAPAIAAAQPGQTPPPPPPPPPGYGYYSAPPATAPGGFMDRQGRLAVGFGLGLGGMNADHADLSCPSCDYNPIAAGIDFHIGGMLSPRLALLLEIQVNGQTLQDYGDGTQTLTQAAILGAAQFWVTPRVWLKGGLGVANLQQTYSDYYDDYDIKALRKRKIR